MRIGIDARTMLSPHHNDSVGTGHVIVHSIKALVSRETEHFWVVFVDRAVRAKDVYFFEQCDHVKVVRVPETAFLHRVPWIYNELMITHALKREQLDLLYVPDSTVRVPVRYRGRFVVYAAHTDVHTHPEHYPSWRVRRQRAIVALNLRRANAVIVPAEKARRQITHYFGVPQEAVHVAYVGVDGRFFSLRESERVSTARRYGMTKKYILFVGTIEPSKNLTRLVQAFALFREMRIARRHRDVSDYQLLIVGRDGYQAPEIKAFIADLDLGGDIRFSGYVTGEEIADLYASASFVVVPTIGEHYGLTTLEAAALGVPCVVHRGGVAQELGDEHVIVVDSYDTHALAEACERARQPEMRAPEMQEARTAHARRHTWARTADKILHVLEQSASDR